MTLPAVSFTIGVASDGTQRLSEPNPPGARAMRDPRTPIYDYGRIASIVRSADWPKRRGPWLLIR